jgi:hypothetical protein
MKFRNLVLLFIAGILVIAWFTKPGKEAFKTFYDKEKKSITSPPMIEEQDAVLYTRYTVSYYDIKSLPDIKISGGKEAAIAVPRSKETYLGLFGRFWKM